MLTLKRRIGLLKPSLVYLRSRLLVYKTVTYPKLCYASNTFLNNNPRGQQFLSSAQYQWLKWLLNIKGNVSKTKLFEMLRIKDKISHNVLELLSLKVIKLRVGCLICKYKRRFCNCSHKIDLMSIMRECEKLKDWRGNWIGRFKKYSLNVYNSLMQITRHRRDGKYVEIVKIINEATEELVQIYFKIIS